VHLTAITILLSLLLLGALIVPGQQVILASKLLYGNSTSVPVDLVINAIVKAVYSEVSCNLFYKKHHDR